MSNPYFSWSIKSITVARQTALGTENTGGTFGVIPVEADVPEASRQIFDAMIATGQIGAKYAPAVGAKRGKIKLKFPVYGFKRGYDPTTEEPGNTANCIPANIVLLGLALGSKSDTVSSDSDFLAGAGLSYSDWSSVTGPPATYLNNDVASVASALTFDVQASHGAWYKPGQMVLLGSSKTDTLPTIGWIKTVSTDTITLIDAAGNIAVVNDDSFGTIVACSTSQQPVPFTLQCLGDNSAFKVALWGCTIDSCKITANVAEPAMVDMEISAAGISEYSSGGGMQALSVTPRIPQPLIGNNGGRVTMGFAGAAMAALTSIREFSLEIADKYADVQGPGSATGLYARVLVDRDVKVGFKIPVTSSDTKTLGKNSWDVIQEDGSEFALALYAGTLPGTVFSILCPALNISEQTKTVLVDGLEHYDIQCRPTVYTGDTGTTAPADTNLRLGWG